MVFARLAKSIGLLSSKHYAWALLKNGVAAAVEHRALLRSMPVVHTFLDIGADRGQFALVAHESHPNATILSFEPRPAPKFLELFRDVRQVRLHQVAVSPQRGSVQMNISAREDSSSLLPISQTQTKIFPGTEQSGTAEVKCAPLTDFVGIDDLAGVVFAKIDVQGFELEVLKACEDVLARFSYIYIECSFIELYEGQPLAHEVTDWLHSRGFRLAGAYNTFYNQNGEAVQADLLFQGPNSVSTGRLDERVILAR